jgi:hypothetical protein
MLNPLKIEKMCGDRLWILSVLESSRAAVDAWEQTVRDYIARVDPAPERYLVYDLTEATNVSFTSYTRQRATILAKDNPQATGRVALVVSGNPAIVYIFDLFLRYTSRQLQPRLDVKLFNERAPAVAWVRAILPPEDRVLMYENSQPAAP